MIDRDELERRLAALAGGAGGAALPAAPALRARAERQRRSRRHRRLVAAACVVVVAGAVTAGVLSQGGPGTVGPASRSGTTTTTTTGPSTTAPPSELARASTALLRYVAAQARAGTAAYKAKRATTVTLAAAPTFAAANEALSVHSAPVDDGGTIVALAAFAFSSSGRPVQVLSYAGGRWSVVATLRVDVGAPVQPRGDPELLALDGAPVAVTDVTGDGRPDFLVQSTSATTTPGLVVSQDGGDGRWRFVPNSGPYPTSDVISGDPQFRHGSLVSTYDSCVPDCASGGQSVIAWTYEPATGDFWAPDPAGDTRANAGPAQAASGT